MDDQQWLELLVRSVKEREIYGLKFPGFPDAVTQSNFVGSADEATLREAFAFYCLVKRYSAALGMALSENRRFLDFGMGWGRFLRFFWKDVGAPNLFGCDVDPEIIQWARELGVPGNLDRLYASGRLPYPDNFFDGGMAYSVFTHLPQSAHRHWLAELSRVMKPGAVFSFTVERGASLNSSRRRLTQRATAGSGLYMAMLQELKSFVPATTGVSSSTFQPAAVISADQMCMATPLFQSAFLRRLGRRILRYGITSMIPAGFGRQS